MNKNAIKSTFRKVPLATILVSFAILVAFTIAQFASQLIGFKYGHHFEGAIIAGMGLWRILTEKDRYQRFRIAFIVGGVTLAWFVIPGLGILFGMSPQYTEFFPRIHKIGSIAFFVFFIPVILFGRAADCGWFCPCVATRETAGYAFRGTTPRGRIWWHLRYLKWPATIVALMLIPAAFLGGEIFGPWFKDVERWFHIYVFWAYFGSFIFLPVLGNRNFCRFGCPYGAIWGIAGKFSFFRIKAKTEDCTSCKKCESVCDMGIPLSKYTNKKSTIRTMECMGCGRCVQFCPKGVLDIQDIRGIRNIPKKVRT